MCDSKKYDISIVICTYNRSALLKKALDSVLNINTRPEISYEVIVIDNNSTDDTQSVVKSNEPKFDGRLKCFIELNKGLSNARNRGIKESEGGIIVFTDDDVKVDRDWILSIYDAFEKYQCDALGGKVLPVYYENTPLWIKSNADLLIGPIVAHDCGEETVRYDTSRHLPFVGANMAFKKHVFKDIGGFLTSIGAGKNTMGEDTEYFHRVNKKFKVFYCGKSVVWHPVEKERMKIKYIAQWNYKLGRYRFLIDEKGKNEEQLVYISGIPRYLIGEIIKLGVKSFIKIFDKREFLKNWTRLFEKMGRASVMMRSSR